MKRIILILLIFFIFSSYVYAIKINEIEPNPTGTDTGNEFVELYNDQPFPVDLNGWKLRDAQGNNNT